MSWAMRRRGVVAVIVIAFFSVIAIWAYFFIFYDPPSCVDHRQNQNEAGVDCGGVCNRLCAPSLAPPQVTFVRAVTSGPGRSDVIAYIDNPNLSAKVNDAHYTIELYDEHNTAVATKEGTIDLPPKRTPLFVPNFFSGDSTQLKAFLTIDNSTLDWFTYQDTRVVFSIRDIVIEHTDTLPRITATVANPSSDSFKNVKVVITVFDEDNNAIAASQTVIPSIKGEGTATVLFTWNAPFTGTAAREEILPILPDPS